TELLQVEDDLGHIFLDVRDRAELMRDAVDLDRGHRRAPQRREQHTAQRVAQGGTKARVQGLDVELAIVRARLELADLRGHCHLCVNRQLGLHTSVFLPRIELDDQLFLDPGLHLVAVWSGEDLGGLLVSVEESHDGTGRTFDASSATSKTPFDGRTLSSSPGLTWYDGTLTSLPLTSK